MEGESGNVYANTAKGWPTVSVCERSEKFDSIILFNIILFVCLLSISFNSSSSKTFSGSARAGEIHFNVLDELKHYRVGTPKLRSSRNGRRLAFSL